MITNERQYTITKAQADRFREALDSFGDGDLAKRGVDPTLVAAQRSALTCQLGDLESEMVHYRRLRSGGVRSLALDDISDIGMRLIEARIVRGLSQKELGQRLGMREQQVQRYEQEGYRTANLARCAAIAAALDLDLRAQLKVKAASPVRSPVPGRVERSGVPKRGRRPTAT